MKARSALVVAVALALLLVCAGSTFAQGATATAQLNGTVTDESGAVVAGASVSARDTDTNTTSTATSNDKGFYFIPNLAPGRYELKVSYTGFAGFTQTGVVLSVGESATVNATLQVAARGEKVVVTTEVQTIEPTKTEISQVVGEQQIQSLPISGRLFTDFALLTPGVATSRTSLGTTITEFEVTQISFGGMRSFSNEITVDGADFVNELSGVQRATPPQDSVQEFRVVNNSFGAEYGRSVGGIVNIVTKSGTNDMHGSAYEYFQNSALDSRSLLQPAPLPNQLRQNQFGATLGGPIEKDKTFFFMNYEGKRRAESPTYPPDLVSNIGLIDEAKALMGLAPEGCTLPLASCTGSPTSYLNGVLKTANNDFGFARLDHQINTNNRVALRYLIEDGRALGELIGNTLDGGGIGAPSGGRDLFVRDQSLFGTLTSVLTPNLVNSFLGQWARRHYNFTGMTGQPDFSILNDLELGHNFGIDDQKYESRIEVSDSISWVKGNHLAKFGFDGNYIWDVDNFPGFTPVRSLVPGISCLANFALFYDGSYGADNGGSAGLNSLAGQCPVASDHGVVFMYAGVPLPTSATACALPPWCAPTGAPLNTSTWANAFNPSLFSSYSHQINHGYWGGFAQDQWRVTPKLTFNFGLRWDFESGLAAYVNPDYTAWQPRIGLAYSPDGKTVLRAGAGMFSDRQNMSFFFIPNTQKVVAGYLCGNHPSAAITALCGPVSPQEMPMLASGNLQATQGYQIFGFPASQGAANMVASIIQTGAYSSLTTGGVLPMAGTCFTTGACGRGAGGMEHNSKLPYAVQASAEIDHQFGKGFALNLGYLFVGAHRLVRGNNINVPCPVGTTKPASLVADPLPDAVPGMLNPNGTLSPCTGTPVLGTGALAGVGPWFAGALGSGLQTLSSGLLDYNNNVANAAYHGLTVTALERWGQYLNLTANYTYSHTIDNGNFTTFINLPVNQFDYAAERANSNQDVRHHFVANFTVNAPNDSFLRNFAFSSIITMQSGRPFTIYYGGNTLNDLAGGATDRVAGGVPGSVCTSVSTGQTMIPRNTYIGDPLYSWDLRVSRAIHISERVKLDLILDAFNVMDRANVDEVTSVYGSQVFCGAIPQHYQDATSLAIQSGAASVGCPIGNLIAVTGGTLNSTPIPGGAPEFIPTKPNANFGMPRTMFNPRQFQIAARFSF